jgi:hypothetical protein
MNHSGMGAINAMALRSLANGPQQWNAVYSCGITLHDRHKELAMKIPPTVNHGEGNPEAAKRFNKAEKAFVGSSSGKKRIRAGVTVQPGEQSDLYEAEQRGKARARE